MLCCERLSLLSLLSAVPSLAASSSANDTLCAEAYECQHWCSVELCPKHPDCARPYARPVVVFHAEIWNIDAPLSSLLYDVAKSSASGRGFGTELSSLLIGLDTGN